MLPYQKTRWRAVRQRRATNRYRQPGSAGGPQAALDASVYQTFFAASLSVMLIIEPVTGRIVDANQAACTFYGYPFERLTALRITDINCLDAEAVAAELALALTQQRHHFRFRHRLASGEVRDVDVYSSPVLSGDRPLLASVIHDVTAHRRTEHALTHATDTVRALSRAVEQSPVSTVITDPAGRIEYVNPKFCQLTGYTAAEAVGQNPRLLKSGLTSPEEYAALWRAITAGDTWTGTFANKKKTGEIYWEQATIGPIREPGGAITHFLAVKEDITERREAEAALRESERKYRLLFENMTAAFALHEMVYDERGRAVDYRFLEVNPAFEQLTGASAAALLGRTVKEIMPETEDYWIEVYGRVVATGEPITYQNYARELGRYYDTFSFRTAPGQFAVVFTDATDRVLAEAALQHSERDFRLLAENSTDMIARLTPDLAFLYVSPAARQLLGFDPQDAVGRQATDFVHPDDRDVLTQALARMMAQPAGDTVAYRYLRGDGTYIWLESTGRAIRNQPTGQALEIQLATRDITERKLAEETVQALSQERFDQAEAAQALAEATAALATALEPEHLRTIILQQMVRVVPCDTAHIYEYREGSVIAVGGVGSVHLPTDVRVCLLEDAAGLFPQAGEQAVLLFETREAPGWRNIPPWTGAHEIRSLLLLPLIVHGELYGCLRVGCFSPGFYLEAHLQVARAFAERIAQSLWNARLYQLEQRRARAAEQLAAMRSDFVDAVSHELRTPLTAMLGYGELLQSHWDKLTDAQRRDRVDRMVDAANRQHTLIENLLRVSRIDSNSPAPRREPVRLAEVVARAARVVRGSYPGQRIDAVGPTDIRATADPLHTEQIVTNLLDNAAKYSEEGRPIHVAWEQEAGMVALRVRDSGAGISAQARDLLFSRFGRVPGSRMRAGHVGTGLGLYLSRTFAEAMGGTLALESTSPAGSVFCLRLPAPVT